MERILFKEKIMGLFGNKEKQKANNDKNIKNLFKTVIGF